MEPMALLPQPLDRVTIDAAVEVAVGDWVAVRDGVVRDLLPRWSALTRADPAEAFWETKSEQAFHIVAWPDRAAEANRWELSVPKLGSWITAGEEVAP